MLAPMPMTAIEDIARSLKRRKAFAARAPATLPEQLIRVIRKSPAIATSLTCHGDVTSLNAMATLRFSAKMIAVRAIPQGFPIANHTQENRKPKNSE